MNDVIVKNETVKENLTRLAAKVADLKAKGNEDEAHEAFKTGGEIFVPIVEEFIDCESAVYKLDDDTKFIFGDKVYEELEKDFYKYNNPIFMKSENKGELYEFKTFLKSNMRDCMRYAISKHLGISQYETRQLMRIKVVRHKLAQELKIKENHVSIEAIQDNFGSPITLEKISYLLEVEKGNLSYDLMMENGLEAATSESEEYGFMKNELDDVVRAELDKVFGKLTGLEVLIILKNKKLLEEELNEMSAEAFAETAIFKILLEKDTQIRTKDNPVRTRNNKSVKMNKVFDEAKNSLDMSEVEGCIMTYFMEKLKKEIC